MAAAAWVDESPFLELSVSSSASPSQGPDDANPSAAERTAAESPAVAAVSGGEQAELQRQGAKAAARGEERESNPMLDSVNRPDATGESDPVWTGRRDAWARGHARQQADRASPADPVGGALPDDRAKDEGLFGVTRVLTYDGTRSLTSASGFFFERDGALYLVTSRHVLFDGPSGHAPDRIEIQLHTDGRNLTQWATLSILLYRDGRAVWRQARDGGGEIDVAVLELERSAMPFGSVVRPFGPEHLAAGFDRFGIGDRLAIPGFPLGFFDTVHLLPVVRQASVASAYGIRFQKLGFFLTDARMHRGGSGSPVLAPREAPSPGGPRWWLLGVHSSRMDMVTRDTVQDESLGLNCAWYADVLMTLTGDAG